MDAGADGAAHTTRPGDAMSESPRVSVVVPFFNRQRFLGACVEALLSQDEVGGPVEIVLVDNGSTDGSAAAVARHPQVNLVREETPGAYAARNTGIRQARAPIIAFTDADCVVDRDWLRTVCDAMRDPTVGILSATAGIRLKRRRR